tara:strand:+ start:333 stop:1115 length:783 start_codon:yes stop_codon:yes gene_type:complete
MIKYNELPNKTIIIAYKPIGNTPLEIIQELKKLDKYKNTKMSYAGRLDPMAHGLMIILLDKECFNQHLYHNLNKTYRFKLLIGISSDTYDILGKIVNNKNPIDSVNKINIKKTILSMNGLQTQFYPPYSSVRVKGNPLWYYAKHNLMDTIEIPSKNIEIKQIDILDETTITRNELLKLVKENINKISYKNSTNFRQDEILSLWETIGEYNYSIFTLKADVSCGTYIRSICNAIGNKLNIPALALDIYRTRVDSYNIELIN